MIEKHTSTGSELLITSAKAPAARLLFAHGAGAPMDSDFMEVIAKSLAERGVEVVRFEFPYMAERRRSGKRRPPNPMPVLIDAYTEQVERWRAIDDLPLFIGGKSMGGRVAASLGCDGIAGTICLGYPFHPVAKPEKLRLEPLQQRTNPVLIVQGDRDKLGSFAEVANYSLDTSLRWHWLADGDHDFKPRKASGHTQSQHLRQTAEVVAAFIAEFENCS